MVYSEEYAKDLEEWWARRGREMPPSNLRQAYHPAGAELLPNPRGTAPGSGPRARRQVDLLRPRCSRRDGASPRGRGHPQADGCGRAPTQVIASRVIRTWGRPESEVAEILDDLYTGHDQPFDCLSRLGLGDQDPDHRQGGLSGRGPPTHRPDGGRGPLPTRGKRLRGRRRDDRADPVQIALRPGLNHRHRRVDDRGPGRRPAHRPPRLVRRDEGRAGGLSPRVEAETARGDRGRRGGERGDRDRHGGGCPRLCSMSTSPWRSPARPVPRLWRSRQGRW